MKTSRTKNAIRNSYVGLIAQVITLFLNFINRTFFIKLLNVEYLSLNGLFSNILSILSFTELGVGTAIAYALYKPVAYEEKEKIKSLLNYYKKVYRIIGITIFGLGLVLIPLFPFIIKEVPDVKESIYLIYILMLASTSATYFFSYKCTLLNVNQQNYLVTLFTNVSKVALVIFQIIFLLLTHNYIVYLLLQIFFNILGYILISIKTNKMYPYIKEKNIKPLDENEKNEIYKNIKGVFLYKLSPVILNGTDNIIISSFIGFTYVGYYSNYYLIVNSLVLFISQFNTAIHSGIGNLIATEDGSKNESIFKKIVYFDFLIYGFCGILVLVLMNDFITIWLGKEFLLSNIVLVSIVLFFYINGMQSPLSSFRVASGLFTKIKYAPVFEVIFNIVFSIIFAKTMGLCGVFLATSLSKILVFFWLDPYVIYKNLFKTKLSKYFISYLKYFLIIVITSVTCFMISNYFVATNYIYWGIKAILLAILVAFMFVLFTFKTEEFKYYLELIKNFIKKIRG